MLKCQVITCVSLTQQQVKTWVYARCSVNGSADTRAALTVHRQVSGLSLPRRSLVLPDERTGDVLAVRPPRRRLPGEVVIPTIDRCGWMVQASKTQARFAYTVGLTAMSLPELVVTGLSASRAARLLNWVGATPSLENGQTITADGLVIELVELPHPEAHLFVADNLYGGQLRAMQLIWADDRGHWPWCTSHRAGRGGQPVLGPRAERAA